MFTFTLIAKALMVVNGFVKNAEDGMYTTQKMVFISGLITAEAIVKIESISPGQKLDIAPFWY